MSNRTVQLTLARLKEIVKDANKTFKNNPQTNIVMFPIDADTDLSVIKNKIEITNLV